MQLDRGRILQKLKTREALIKKANELLLDGNLTSIEQVAKEADISKATAYRYFNRLDDLKREASLQFKAISSDNLFQDLPEADLNGRLERLITYHFKLLIDNEIEFRHFLSSVIVDAVNDDKKQLRGGRRIALITDALLPLKYKISSSEFDQMVNALSLIFGIESITILRDLCHLDNNGILESWNWTVSKIVHGSFE